MHAIACQEIGHCILGLDHHNGASCMNADNSTLGDYTEPDGEDFLTLDWLQVLVADVPYLVVLVSAAGGVQGLNAINTMEFMYAVPLVLPISQASQVFDDQGKVTDDRVAQQLTKLGEEVARAASQVSNSGTCDYAEHAQVNQEAAS